MTSIPTDPPLSVRTSHLLALGFLISYTGSLYVAKNARIRFGDAYNARLKVQLGSRNDPAVIRARSTAVTIACVLSCCVVFLFVVKATKDPNLTPMRRLGIQWPPSVLSCLQTPLLFLGPIYASYLGSTLPGQKNYSFKHDFVETFFSWMGFRNYLWAPLTEEVVFRACVICVYNMAGASRGKMIAFAPLVFGLAHVHHSWEVFNQLGATPTALKRAIISAVFQMAYTCLFGAHASFLFLRTSSLVPPLTAHIFCNIMGIPDIGAQMRRTPGQRDLILWAYILGIALFFWTLMPFTLPSAGDRNLYWA